MFEGVASADKDPRKTLHVGDVPTPELAPDEVYVAVMASSSINFNTVWTSIFEPLPTFGFLDRLGRESEWGARHAPRLPRGRLRRLRRRAAGRLGGAQLEAGRPGHGALQLRRRPGPVGPRRLDARRQPAHLGLRDQLRRPRRPRRRQGQPADAQADPPHVGGGGGQRAVQLARSYRMLVGAARRAHEAGRRRARLGRHRRHRRLRRAVRAQRRRHPGRRRVVAGARPQLLNEHGLSRPSSTARPRATSSGPTSTPRTRASGAASARTSATLIGEDPDIVFEHPGRQTMGASVFAAKRGGTSSPARRRRATWSSSTTATSG